MPKRGTRGVAMPKDIVLPPGAHRELLLELHRLYHLAGTPSLRVISSALQNGDEFRATINRNKVSEILSGVAFPTTMQLDSLVHYFAKNAVNELNQKEERARFLDFWMRTQAERQSEGPSMPDETIESALRRASSAGTSKPLIALCADANPEMVINVLGELDRRRWNSFSREVIESLGETFSASNVPMLISELRLSENYSWDSNRVITVFGAVRSNEDCLDLLHLLRALGSNDDVVTLVLSFSDARSPREVADFYLAIHQAGIAASEFRSNYVRSTPPPTKLLAIILAMKDLNFPLDSIISFAMFRFTSSLSAGEKAVVHAATELKRRGLSDVASALIVAALEDAQRNGYFSYRKFLASDQCSREDKEVFLSLASKAGIDVSKIVDAEIEN
ncbi:hypothetical protein [Streptomyces mirabilis]|uniref:hypothetical protein n=1 Tax=Streptomyces mirabilis TaxID=68239 RepID=UPI0036764263